MAKNKNQNIYWIIGIVAVIALIIFRSNSPLGVVSLSTTNIIPNGGFETQDPISYALPQYWTVAVNGDATHLFSVDSTVFRSGSKSLHYVVNNSAKSWFGLWQKNIPIKEGKTYKIEYYAKTKNLPIGTGLSNGTGGYPDRIMMEFKEYYANGTQLVTYGGVGCQAGTANSCWDAHRNSDWFKLSGFYKMQPGATNLSVRFLFYTTNGEVWFDDFSIVEAIDDPNVLLNNGNFEIWNNEYADTSATGSSDSNTAYGWYAGQGGGIIQKSTDSKSGSAMKLSYAQVNPTTCTNACSWNHSYIAQDVYLTLGNKYRVSSWIKSGGKVGFNLQRQNWNGNSGSLTINGDNTWKYYSYEFVAVNYSLHRLVFDLYTQNPYVIVDDTKLENLGQATSCSSNSQCSATETCLYNYCMKLNCVPGYHVENQLCIKDPIVCPTGQVYNAQTLKCEEQAKPSIFSGNMTYIIIALIAIGLIIFLMRKKR